MECLVNYFLGTLRGPRSGADLVVARQSYRGQLPRFDQSRAKLMQFSKDSYYPLEKQTSPGVLQVYAVKEGVANEALSPCV